LHNRTIILLKTVPSLRKSV